jgi:hypothetical protein
MDVEGASVTSGVACLPGGQGRTTEQGVIMCSGVSEIVRARRAILDHLPCRFALASLSAVIPAANAKPPDPERHCKSVPQSKTTGASSSSCCVNVPDSPQPSSFSPPHAHGSRRKDRR